MSQRFGASPLSGYQSLWDGDVLGLPDTPLTNVQMQQLYLWINELALIHGLVSASPLVVSSSTRSAGTVSQSVAQAGDTVTVSRA